MCGALCSVGRLFLYPISSHLDRIITPHSLELFFLFAFLTLFCFFCFSFWVLYGVSPAFLYPGPNCRHTHSLIHYTQHTHSVFLHGSFFLYILYIIGDSICHNTRVWVGRSVGTVNFWLFIFLGLGVTECPSCPVLSVFLFCSILIVLYLSWRNEKEGTGMIVGGRREKWTVKISIYLQTDTSGERGGTM